MKIPFTRSRMPFICPAARAPPPAAPPSARAAIWSARVVQNSETAACVGASGVPSVKIVIFRFDPVRDPCRLCRRIDVAIPERDSQGIPSGWVNLVRLGHPYLLEVLRL